jgi:hypothetical protein
MFHTSLRAFETHVTGVLDKLDTRLSSLTDPRLRNIEVVMANHGLVDASFQQLTLLCHTISPALGEIVKTIRSSHSLFLTDIQRSSAQFLEDIAKQQQDIDRLHEQLHNSEIEISRLMEVADLLDKVCQ